jgi:two-component system, OmpR family, phosphate regulon response regulator PhoB
MQANVLVVDDETPIRDMVCFALRQSDFECSQAASAEDAYDKICKTRPDIILLDWMLPDTSGIDFLKMLYSKELYQDIPIIMLTAKTEETDKLQGLQRRL